MCPRVVFSVFGFGLLRFAGLLVCHYSLIKDIDYSAMCCISVYREIIGLFLEVLFVNLPKLDAKISPFFLNRRQTGCWDIVLKGRKS